MSAIDALTSNSNVVRTLSTLSSGKKNKDLDFNAILMASMRPGLPGIESDAGQSQTMMQAALVQQMQSLIETLTYTIEKMNKVDNTNTTTTSGE